MFIEVIMQLIPPILGKKKTHSESGWGGKGGGRGWGEKEDGFLHTTDTFLQSFYLCQSLAARSGSKWFNCWLAKCAKSWNLAQNTITDRLIRRSGKKQDSFLKLNYYGACACVCISVCDMFFLKENNKGCVKIQIYIFLSTVLLKVRSASLGGFIWQHQTGALLL